MRKRTIAIMNAQAASEEARQTAADQQIAEMNAVMERFPYRRHWKYQPAAPIPPWVAPLAHDRDCSSFIFVKTVDGFTEVRPGERLTKVKGGVRAQVVRATDAA